MFAAAMLSAFAELEEPLRRAMQVLSTIGLGEIRLERHHDGTFDALHLSLDGPDRHEHRNWADIRAILHSLDIDEPVRARALAIFTLIAEAEASVHDVDVEAVHFHEVGAWDSIADILMAAWLIEKSGIESWSTGPVPLGHGTVQTRHGPMPVPAPATVRLLEGLHLVDDGIGGERVTPTGAAILRHLLESDAPARGRLVGQAIGRGTRELAGRANILRVLLFEDERTAEVASGEHILEMAFEIDDQSGEDLAFGLDRLRCMNGVLDIMQMPAFAKKGRMATAVRLLVEPASREDVAAACFTQTATLGLRIREVERLVLSRVQLGAVKLAFRPDGALSAKVESDALEAPSAFARLRERHARVEAALAASEKAKS